jgi:hypothetical protein
MKDKYFRHSIKLNSDEGKSLLGYNAMNSSPWWHSTHAWNVGLLHRDYTALYPRRLSSSKKRLVCMSWTVYLTGSNQIRTYGNLSKADSITCHSEFRYKCNLFPDPLHFVGLNWHIFTDVTTDSIILCTFKQQFARTTQTHAHPSLTTQITPSHKT